MSEPICKHCTDQTCLIKGKPCKDIESYMRRDGIKSAQYIRPERSTHERVDGLGRHKELPMSGLVGIEMDKSEALNPIPEWHGYYRGLKRAIRNIFK